MPRTALVATSPPGPAGPTDLVAALPGGLMLHDCRAVVDHARALTGGAAESWATTRA